MRLGHAATCRGQLVTECGGEDLLLGLSGPLDSRRLGGQNGQVVVVAERVLQVEQVVLHLGAALLDQRGELGRLLANHFCVFVFGVKWASSVILKELIGIVCYWFGL